MLFGELGHLLRDSRTLIYYSRILCSCDTKDAARLTPYGPPSVLFIDGINGVIR